jgi:hypothetical protein
MANIYEEKNVVFLPYSFLSDAIFVSRKTQCSVDIKIIFTAHEFDNKKGRPVINEKTTSKTFILYDVYSIWGL